MIGERGMVVCVSLDGAGSCALLNGVESCVWIDGAGSFVLLDGVLNAY